MTTSESFRQDVAAKLNRIVDSADPTASVNFPSCLSAEERKYVHHVSEQFGLQHISKGKGDGRFITVTRDPAKASRRGLVAPRAPRLRLPKEAWEALEHPLVVHASRAGNIEALAEGAPLLAVSPEDVSKLLGRQSKRQKASPKGAASGAAGGGPPQTPLLAARQGLPAWAKRAELLEAVGKHQVTMVVGETGCGKSTQIPQFLVEEGGPTVSVLVTQPRKLSALGLAHRVAQERGESVGETAGYSVHLENMSSSSTQLLFCTTGVFRRRMLADPKMEGVTHLVLDELHEREKVADFLLVAVRDLLAARPEMRLVLMSATMQLDTFRNYFPGCAEVHIEGRMFPVKEYFLEDIAPTLHGSGAAQALGPGFAAGGLGFGSWDDRGKEKTFKYQVLVSHTHDRDGLCGFSGNSKKALSGSRLEEGLFLHDVLQQTKGVLYDLPIVEALLLHLSSGREGLQGDAAEGKRGAGGVLVFLPGWDDIDRLKRRFRKHPVLGDASRFWVLPLHSQVRLEQQREVFKRPPPGVRKVILSTNIAETSITVDDIEFVIDCGRAKETSYDSFMRVPMLNTSWISRAQVAQRVGRAGRVAPGVCYHIFSKRRAEVMDAHRPPEMLRTALDDVCLHAKLLLTLTGRPEVPIAHYLGQVPDPPDERSVRNAELLLQEIGALTSSADKPVELTALGVHLCMLPLSAQFAKIVIWAKILGVGDGALSVVSALQYREPFVSLNDAQLATSLADANKAVRAAKRELCGPHASDHIALLRACELFEDARARGGDAAREFCDAHCLSFKQMFVLQQTRGKMRSELVQRGIWSPTQDRGCDAALLSAALCAGLFPNVSLRKGAGGKMKANGGRLEALPHPSSVASFTKKGDDFWDTWGKAASKHVDEEGAGSGDAADRWFCFNELNQIEEHYSLSGLSPVPVIAVILFCGEDDLVISEVEGCSGADQIEETGEATAVSDAAFSSWWAVATSGEPSPSEPSRGGGREEGADGEPVEAPSDGDVVIRIRELGDWLGFRVRCETASRLQALRAMLRLLFRVFCSDSSRWAELTAEGQVGSAVLEIAGALVRAEAGAPEAADARGAQPAAAGAAASRPRAAKGRGRGAERREGRQGGGAADQGAGGQGRGSGAPPKGRGEQPRVGKAAGARPGDGGLAEGDGARDAEARGNPSGQRAGPAHPSQSRGAGPAGSGPSGPRARGCDTCKGRYAEGDGCRDASGAGSWHCFGCWEAYYAAQREQQQTWQRPWHDQQQTWQRPWQAQQQTWQQPWHEQEQHQDWQRPVRQGNGGQEMGRGPKKQYNKIR